MLPPFPFADIWPIPGPNVTVSGLYKYKHNPCAAINYTSQPKFAHRNTGYNTFLKDLKQKTLPAYSFVVPDQVRSWRPG